MSAHSHACSATREAASTGPPGGVTGDTAVNPAPAHCGSTLSSWPPVMSEYT